MQSGTGIHPKRVIYAYNAAGQPATKNIYTPSRICQTRYTYDGMGRLTGMVQHRGNTVIAEYDLGWDAKRLTSFDITTRNAATKTAAYGYDDTDQLTVADYNFQTDESYQYDANGNRKNSGYVTGPNNQLTYDGTHTYTYDDEGNCTTKRRSSTGATTTYTWDHRNRLVQVVTPTETVEYAYDHQNRMIRRNSEFIVNDGYQMALILNPDGTVKQRHFWGRNTDELITEEKSGSVSWTLCDHLGTIRDTISSTGTILNHLEYNAFGQLTTSTNPTTLPFHRYTAKPFDTATSLQYNINRWYDSTTGRWMSTDPIDFGGGEVNLYRYVINQPTLLVDINGEFSWIPILVIAAKVALSAAFTKGGREIAASSVTSSDFEELGWGDIKDEPNSLVAANFGISEIGEADRTTGASTPCSKPGAYQTDRLFYRYGNAWSYSKVEWRVDWSSKNGCDIEGLEPVIRWSTYTTEEIWRAYAMIAVVRSTTVSPWQHSTPKTKCITEDKECCIPKCLRVSILHPAIIWSVLKV